MSDREPPYDELARILDAEDESRYGEADEILDRARANGNTLFRVWRFQYALYPSRLAARRGRWDEAAAFASGALWQVAEDEEGPLLPRRPDGGRVNTDQEAVDELWRYAESGNAERYDALVEDYRSPDNAPAHRGPLGAQQHRDGAHRGEGPFDRYAAAARPLP